MLAEALPPHNALLIEMAAGGTTSRLLYLQCMTLVPLIKGTVLPSAVHVEETSMDKWTEWVNYSILSFTVSSFSVKKMLFVFFFW